MLLNRASKRPELGDQELTFICVPINLNRKPIGAMAVDLRFKPDRDYDRTSTVEAASKHPIEASADRTFHGEADRWLSPEHSVQLMARAPAGSVLRLVPHDNHVTLPLQIAPFEREVIAWFDAAFTKP
jgi:hypothetical protein